MAENLKTTMLNDGTEIPMVSGNDEFIALRTPAFPWYKNDPLNKNKYCGLYNWYSVKTGKRCPAGWNISSDAEWMTLEIFLGMSNDDATGLGDRSTDQGVQLKSPTGWNSSIKIANPSGFADLPAGPHADDESLM